MSKFQSEYSIAQQSFEDLSLVVKSGSVIIGDKGYISALLAEKLKAQGQSLLACSLCHC